MAERTLAIAKPDSFGKGQAAAVLHEAERAGLKIVAAKTLRLTQEQAGGFYAVHKDRPFFGSLVEFMTSGPVLVAVLEGDGAIKKWRDTMGATDPKKAAAGTVRAQFGTDVEHNASHGSDAPDTAAFEIGYFFGGSELNGLA